MIETRLKLVGLEPMEKVWNGPGATYFRFSNFLIILLCRDAVDFSRKNLQQIDYKQTKLWLKNVLRQYFSFVP